MEKKRVLLLILCLFNFSLFLLPNGRAEPFCNVINLSTDKDFYFYHESINLSAIWETYYDHEEEYLYVQLRILDASETLIWNSSIYDEMGIISKNWNIVIQNLNFTFGNNPYNLSIRFYRYYNNQYSGFNESIYLRALNITITKSYISCQLVGFKNDLSYGENLEFKAEFRYLSNSSEVIDQEINFFIKSDDLIVYQQNYSSNANGTITIYVSTLENLRIGYNLLNFEIINQPYINDSIFQYSIFVSKSKIYIEIIEFEETIALEDILEIKLKFYYLNFSVHPLINEWISLTIYQNSSLKYEVLLTTNSTGYLEVSLAPSDFVANEADMAYSILILYYGTNFFENASISLQLTIIEKNDNDVDLFGKTLAISLSSIFLITTLMFFVIKHYKKKENGVKLKDITFKL